MRINLCAHDSAPKKGKGNMTQQDRKPQDALVQLYYFEHPDQGTTIAVTITEVDHYLGEVPEIPDDLGLQQTDELWIEVGQTSTDADSDEETDDVPGVGQSSANFDAAEQDAWFQADNHVASLGLSTYVYVDDLDTVPGEVPKRGRRYLADRK